MTKSLILHDGCHFQGQNDVTDFLVRDEKFLQCVDYVNRDNCMLPIDDLYLALLSKTN